MEAESVRRKSEKEHDEEDESGRKFQAKDLSDSFWQRNKVSLEAKNSTVKRFAKFERINQDVVRYSCEMHDKQNLLKLLGCDYVPLVTTTQEN
ncbi:hypothetical protein AVEN_20768-1 [Araneus ventricosus]|uniref:Uncharacterized protein n=1 Tax=Araneus ventricosus TaxID=182803 RepID=A0A4Y2NGB0_ARAVE|nr:hypothetical protein AVEN_20768-1 [Araneus ventricosus]